MGSLRRVGSRRVRSALSDLDRSPKFLYLGIPLARRSVAQSRRFAHSSIQPDNEAHSIHAIDKLLKAVRVNSDPAFQSSVPLRAPQLWAETLSGGTQPTNTADGVPVNPYSPMESRRMHGSYTQIILPFRSDPLLLEKYTNAAGGIRVGKIMEHLDSLAGSIAYKHLLGPNISKLGRLSGIGFYVVTASVDRLDMLGSLYPVDDILLSGHVIFTGHSSMEIVVKMESLENEDGSGSNIGAGKTLMIGRFSMVCRDAFTHKARKVNPLVLTTEEERALYSMGQSHKDRRKADLERALTRTPPTFEEALALHQVYLTYGDSEILAKSGVAALDPVWIENTKLENSLLMFPQERNIHQKVFGGYLMRQAYELGYTSSILFTRHPIQFLSLDGISFKKPVPIGSILHLTSHVTCTEQVDNRNSLVHVVVRANVVNPLTGSEENTNDFRFTWGSSLDSDSAVSRVVVPRTYQDSIRWLEGKRALALGAEIRGLERVQ